MTGFEFKTYIAEGREYFEYRDATPPGVPRYPLTKKDFPFPESLLSLLDLDIWKYEPSFKKIDRALLELYSDRDARHVEDIMAALDTLAGVHIYFEFLRFDWRCRMDEAERQGFQDVLDLLPHKTISHIPSNIDAMQTQIRTLFSKCLDIDSGKEAIARRVARFYYEDSQSVHGRSAFEFHPLPMQYESISGSTFTEVLRPTSIYDLIEFSVRACVQQEQRMRVCKNCGRWFAITGRTTAEYCSRAINAKGRTCKDVGAAALWTKSKSDDKVFKEYRREYKKRFAWIKAGRVTADEFYAWSEKARAKKAECDDGRISLAEYSQWLQDS